MIVNPDAGGPFKKKDCLVYQSNLLPPTHISFFGDGRLIMAAMPQWSRPLHVTVSQLKIISHLELFHKLFE